MTKIFRDLKIIMIIGYFCMPLQAREIFDFYSHSRSLAMGGVSLAITSDETAVFRNAANLGSFRRSYVTIFDPEIETSSNFFNQVNSNYTSQALDIKSVAELLANHKDQYYHAKLQLTPSFVVRNFGLGLIYRNELSTIMNTAGTEMDTVYQNDLGAVLSYNARLFSGIVKWGLSARAFNRISVDNANLNVSSSLDLKDIASEGNALAFDSGLMIQMPVLFLPTVSILVKDIGNTRFSSSQGMRLTTTALPDDVPQTVDAALSFMPIHGSSRRSVVSVEYKDVTKGYDQNFLTRQLGVGFETTWNDIFSVRAGLHQGYWSAGLEISSEYWSWQLASYGEEVGIESQKKEDRRLNTKFTVRF